MGCFLCLPSIAQSVDYECYKLTYNYRGVEATGFTNAYTGVSVNESNGQVVKEGYVYKNDNVKLYNAAGWGYISGTWNKIDLEVNIWSFETPDGQNIGDYNQDTEPSGNCDTCVEEEAAAKTECGVDNWEWTDEENCEYKCIIPPACDATDIASAVAQCGNDNYTLYEIPGPDAEHPECGWRCDDLDCNDDYLELKNYCAYGVSYYNWETCNGSCRACYPDARDDVREICQNKGGVSRFSCEIVNGDTAAQRKVDIKYLCFLEEPDVPEDDTSPPDPVPDDTDDGESAPDADDQDPTTDPNDPDNQPAEDTPDSPDATDTEKTNNRLDDINENLKTQVDQNNSQIGQLNTIIGNTETTANNTQTIADNQGDIQDEIRLNTQSASENTSEVVGSVEGIQGNNFITDQPATLGDILSAIVKHDDSIDFGALKTNATAPTLDGTEFNPDFPDADNLPDDGNYTEFDDNTTLASDQAAAYAEENLVIDPENSPINAEITATGDPCLDGNISLHGHSIPVSICFNRPWMLQGYAIMKILMIGIAYLQTAILLNKAIIR